MVLPDFNRLKVFYYVYLNKSAASAARGLYISQSAVSQSLGKLETELKSQLFTRLHRKLAPTAAAKGLFEIIEPFVSGLEAGIRRLEGKKAGEGGSLRIGAPVEFGSRYLIKLISEFRKKHPGVFFEVALGHPTALLPGLAEGELDFVFADIFAEKGGFQKGLSLFTITPVMREKLVLAVSREYHRKHFKGSDTLSCLLKCDFLDYQKSSPALNNWFRHHFGKPFSGLKTVLIVESVQAIIHGIRNGAGLGVIPEYLVKREIRGGAIKVIGTGKSELVNRISLVRLQGKTAAPAEAAFLEFSRTAPIDA